METHLSGELDANRPVPFRLTPNMAEFITPFGVNGVISASMVAAARCLVEPPFGIQSILRAVLRDEMIAWHKKVSFTKRFFFYNQMLKESVSQKRKETVYSIMLICFGFMPRRKNIDIFRVLFRFGYLYFKPNVLR